MGRNAGVKSDQVVTASFLYLLPAQMLSLATASLGNVINSIVVGNLLPPVALVSLGLVTPMVTILASLSSIVSGGARILCGKALGSGNADQIKRIFRNSMILLLSLGVLLTLVGVGLARPIAMLLGAKEDIIAPTTAYVRGLSIGIIPTLIVPCMMVFLQTINDGIFAVYGSVVLAAGSLLFGLANAKLMNGSLFGIGIAAALSQLITMLFLILRIRKHRDMLSVSGKGVDRKGMTDIIRLGSPSALIPLLYSVRNIFLNTAAMKFGGTDTVSILAVFNNFCSLFDAMPNGVGNTCVMLVAMYVGLKDDAAVLSTARTGIRIGLAAAVVRMGILVIFGRSLYSLFGLRADLIPTGTSYIYLYLPSALEYAITQTVLAVYQCKGRVTTVNILSVFVCLVFPVTIVFGFGSQIGPSVIWLMHGICDALSMIILAVISTVKNGHFPRNLADYCRIEGNNPSEKLSLSVRTMEQVMDVSNQVRAYTLEHGVDKRRSMLCGLALEEMAGNIVEHGFTKSRKKNLTVDIFVNISGEDILIELCDSAPSFDPMSRLNVYDPEDELKGSGIRMIKKIAKKMEYQSTYGLNMLSITL